MIVTHLEKVSDSGVPLIDLDEAKEYLKVSYTSEDRLITNLIEQVINDMEAYMWASLQASVYKIYASDFGNIPLMRGPVDAITSVQYYDEGNSLQTLASSGYFLCKGVPDTLGLAYNQTWPTSYRRNDAVIVTYSTDPTVESRVRVRALRALGYLFENRSTLEMSMNDVYKAMVSGARRKHF